MPFRRFSYPPAFSIPGHRREDKGCMSMTQTQENHHQPGEQNQAAHHGAQVVAASMFNQGLNGCSGKPYTWGRSTSR